VIWFFSPNNTEKVEAIRTSQRVNLAYVDHSGKRYVSVSGYCELVRDHAKAKELWSSDYKAWFPGGLDDANLILLKVNVQQAEYWDAAQGRMAQLLALPMLPSGSPRRRFAVNTDAGRSGCKRRGRQATSRWTRWIGWDNKLRRKE